MEVVDCFLQMDKNTFLGSKKLKFEALNKCQWRGKPRSISKLDPKEASRP